MIRRLLMAVIICTPALADTPLPPAEDWRVTHSGGVIVESVVETEQTTITPPSSPAWILPFWALSFAIHPSPDGEFVLVSSLGANLLS